MADITDRELLEKLKRRQASLARERKGYEAHWREVARFTQPRLGQFMHPVNSKAYNQGGELNSKLLDDRGIWASEVLANGMYSGMSSPAAPWFKLRIRGDEDLNDQQDVKEWLSTCEKRLYDFFASTNFYTAQKTGYLELGVFGTQCSVMQEHWRYGGVTYPLTVGQYSIGLDDALVANTMVRSCDMTTSQLYEMFYDAHGESNFDQEVKNAWAHGDYQKNFCCYHAIEPNVDRAGNKIDRTNMPFRSIYWQASSTTKILDFGGYMERPFWAPRWDVVGSEVYGRSPGMNGLPNLRQLQYETGRLQNAIDYSLFPPLVGPATLQNTHTNIVPKGITTMAGIDKDQFRPIWEVDHNVIGHLTKRIEDTRQTVDRSFFADLFMAITNMQGIQPRVVAEIASRNEEKLTQLGPSVERNQNEQLKVAIDRAFAILSRTNQLPPAPDVLQGQAISVVFVSVLAQLQRAVGVGSMERVLGFIGNIAGAYPAILNKADFETMVDEYAERTGVSPKTIRSTEEAEKITESQAQAQRAAQMAASAPAARDGAQAAELLSKTDTGDGTSMLSRVLGRA